MNAFSEFFSKLSMKPQGITLVVAGFLPIFAIVTMFPVVASMIQHFGSDPDAASKVPLMVTAPGLTIALLAPFAGLAVDRLGRRRLLLICTFAYGLFGTAPFFLSDLDQIFASRLLLGVCEAGILTVVNTLIADYWDETGRRNWLFVQGLLGTFFASAVIVLSGAISSVQWNAGFLIYLVAFPIFFAMLAYLFEPKAPEASTASAILASDAEDAFPYGSAFVVALVTLLSAALYYVFIVNGSIAFGEIGVRDPAEVSRITYLPSLFVMLGAVFFKLLSRTTNGVQLAAFLIVLGTGLTGIGLATTLNQMIAAVIIQQTGAGMAVPTLIAWAQTKFPFQHRGRGMGVWTSAFFFGQFASPLLVHQFASATGTMQGGFLAAGLLAVIFALTVAFLGYAQSRGARSGALSNG